MASAISAISNAANPTSGTTGSNDLQSAPSEEMFLQLLVSQLQNQDPLNPTDSTQFVSQLAQFSELEQVMAIRSDIETQMASGAGAGATPGSGTPTNSTSAGGTPANSSTSNTGQTPASNLIPS